MAAVSLIKHTSLLNIFLGPLAMVKKVTNGEEEGTWAEVEQALESKVRDFANEEVTYRKS